MKLEGSISVTTGLKLLKFTENWGTEYDLERGTAVHLACSYFDLGVLDRNSLDPALVGYLDGYALFHQEMGPITICDGDGMEGKAIEEKVAIEGMHGTLDRRFMVRGKHKCCDLKSGSPVKANRWQSILYSLIWAMQNGKTTPEPTLLYLPGNGKYRWVQFENWWRDVQRSKSLITAAHIAKEIHSDKDYAEIEVQAEIEAGI